MGAGTHVYVNSLLSRVQTLGQHNMNACVHSQARAQASSINAMQTAAQTLNDRDDKRDSCLLLHLRDERQVGISVVHIYRQRPGHDQDQDLEIRRMLAMCCTVDGA